MRRTARSGPAPRGSGIGKRATRAPCLSCLVLPCLALPRLALACVVLPCLRNLPKYGGFVYKLRCCCGQVCFSGGINISEANRGGRLPFCLLFVCLCVCVFFFPFWLVPACSQLVEVPEGVCVSRVFLPPPQPNPLCSDGRDAPREPCHLRHSLRIAHAVSPPPTVIAVTAVTTRVSGAYESSEAWGTETAFFAATLLYTKQKPDSSSTTGGQPHIGLRSFGLEAKCSERHNIPPWGDQI